MNSLGERRCQIQKSVNVHRAILRNKTFGKSRSFAIHIQFTLFHLTIDLIVLASPKTILGNKSPLSGFHGKQKSLCAFTTWKITLKSIKFSDLKTIIENNSTFVQTLRKRK